MSLFRHLLCNAIGKGRARSGSRRFHGVLDSILRMLERGVTHIGVATDHVIESFHNDMYPGYKTGAGLPPDLLLQFPILEQDLETMSITVWPMIEFEADDALASAAVKAALDSRVSRVVICTPDKDLSQCVRGTRIVQLDRRTNIFRDEDGVQAKFGVKPESIPDYLALVGDTADGFPGIPGWGKKAAATVLSTYPQLEKIPQGLAGMVSARPQRASAREFSVFSLDRCTCCFRSLATLRTDLDVFDSVDRLEWKAIYR